VVPAGRIMGIFKMGESSANIVMAKMPIAIKLRLMGCIRENLKDISVQKS
jgi:hypothetical protein